MLSKNIISLKIKGIDKPIEFEECSMMECFDMLENIKQDKNTVLKFILGFCNKYGIDMKRVNMDTLWSFLSKNYFGGFFDADKSDNKDPQAPTESIIDFIGERYGVNPFKLLSEITYTQFKALMEGARWNLNETTDKGRAENAKWRKQNMNKQDFKNRMNKLDDFIKNRESLIKQGKLKETYKQKI